MSAPNIDHRQVQRLIEQGAQVLDALPPEEYKRLHIAGALSMPLHEVVRGLDTLDRGRAVVTYCADNQCDLSGRLAARFVFEGFGDVYEYGPSLADWAAYGLPLEGDDAGIVTAGDLADRDAPTCAPDELVSEVLSRLAGATVCAVIDKERFVLGRLRPAEVETDAKLRVRDVMHPGPSTFRPDVYAQEMAEWFEKRPQTDDFLITTPDGRLFGVLYRAAVEHVAGHAAESHAG